MKIAVFSDVHSNSTALKKTIDMIERENVNEVVFLGDLLTYGCNVIETIDLLMKFSNERKVHFIKGNHDQIYFDMQDGKNFQYKPFPEFILESALYTGDKLECKLHELFQWKQSITIGNVLFSHANALGDGNWSYLNNDQEIIDTASVILQKGYLGGVFGHTHRPKLSIYQIGNDIQNLSVIGLKQLIIPYVDKCFVANSGSVGQPRGIESSILFIDINLNNSHVELEVKTISYNKSEHCENIKSSTLSQITKDKLISYYKN
jgi:predicted phosphodiesterase